MWWQILIVLATAVASYFVPTPKEMQEVFTGGQNLFAASNYKKAIEQYDIILNTQSRFLREDSVRVTLFNGELTVGVIPAAQYQKGNALRNLGMADSAVSYFRLVEARPGERELSALAQFQIYDIFYASKRFPQAIAEARKLVAKYPKHKKAQGALYDIGWAFKETGVLDSSNGAFLELITTYPGTDYLAKSLYQLGQNNYDQKQFDAAIYYWSRLNQEFKPEAFKDKEWENVQLKSTKERQIFEATSSRETDATNLELVAKAQVKIGDCYKEKNMYDSSMANYRKVITNYSLLPVLVEATYIKMAEYTRSFKGIEEGQAIYRAAIDDNFANKELQAKLQYKIAEAYQNEKLYKRAAEEYEFYARAYAEVAPNINFTVEDALYTQIVCLYNGDFFPQVIAETDTFLTEFESGAYSYELSFLAALSAFNIKDYPNAKIRFTGVAAKGSGQGQYVAAKVFLSRIAFEEREFAYAAGLLDTLRQEYPNHKYADEIHYYLIQNYYELKNYDTIPVLFEQIPRTSPFFVPVFIKVAKSFTLQKKYDEGEKFIRRYVALADSIKDSVYMIPEVHFSLADLQIARQQYTEAVGELSIVIADGKTNELLKLQSTFLRGTLFGQVNKHQESVKDLEFVLNSPVFMDKMRVLVPNARGRLATAYAKTGQVQKAVDMMLGFVAESADTLEKVRYLVALTEVVYENKDMNKTITYGEQSLAYNINDDFLFSRASYLTATAYNNTSKFDKAMVIMETAVKRFPAINEDIFFNFGVNLYDNAYYENAVAVFTRFTEYYPASATKKNASFFSAYAWFKLGKWDKAVPAFENFIKEYPKDDFAAEAQYNIGECYYNQGMFDKAITEYGTLYTKYPKSSFAAPAIYNQAWCFYQLKEMEKMIAPLQKLVKEFPQSPLVPEAQFTIGDYYYNAKDYQKALTEYKAFVEKFPEHEKSEQARSFIKELSQIDAFRLYKAAMVIFDSKNYQKAIEELDKIVLNNPDTEVAMACEANIASAYEQMGDKQKALDKFRQIIEKYKNNPVAAGVVYFAQQHVEWIEGDETARK